MAATVLVTGGAGFIGSHLVDSLLERGHRVRVFDNLEPQVHGPLRENGKWPTYCNQGAEYTLGDVRDRQALLAAMMGAEVIYHQAAMVGVGQSMYQIERYVDVNTHGTAVLLDIMANESSVRDKIRKVIVASSMSIYGEGGYLCSQHGEVFPQKRDAAQMAANDWELHCTKCDRHVSPLPTREDKPLIPSSIYAISKKDQEEMCLVTGRAYQVPVVALRYFNTYGPRQSLSNPYTGVAAIFAARLLNDKPPVIFEDGLQSRDFIHVSDVVKANLIAMESEDMNDGVYNVGTGRQSTILDVARVLAQQLGKPEHVEIVNEFRAGDIRHCIADIGSLKKIGFRPVTSVEDGMAELAETVHASVAKDDFDQARAELTRRGLAD